MRCGRINHRQASSSAPITVYSLRTRKEFVLREEAEAMEDGRDVMEVLNRLLLADGYVMTMAFETAGSNAVVKALTGWAREEANKFPRVRRGKGAAPPFEWLKWLAASRLEEARQAWGISFSEVQRMLLQHAREHPLPEAAPTLPIYSSHGAWSKAIGDARKWLIVHDGKEYPSEHPALVSAELWAEANEALNSDESQNAKQQERDKHGHLLKGILKCGQCGATLTLSQREKGSRWKSVLYHTCTHVTKK